MASAKYEFRHVIYEKVVMSRNVSRNSRMNQKIKETIKFEVNITPCGKSGSQKEQ